jgi:hypothetical protein
VSGTGLPDLRDYGSGRETETIGDNKAAGEASAAKHRLTGVSISLALALRAGDDV